MIAATLILLVAQASAFRIGLVNDIHLDLTYSKSCGQFCLDLGIYNDDPPVALLQEVLGEMQASGNFDAVLVSGDLVVHGLSSDNPNKSNWPQMQETIATITDELNLAFSNTPILFSIGNNDVEYHYQAPNSTDKEAYYADMFKMWFQDIPYNKEHLVTDEVEETFLEGGYFKVELEEGLTFISLNSILVNYKNEVDLEQADKMLSWLEESLQEDSQFIIFMHIPPALLAFSSTPTQMWASSFVQRYLDILIPYQSKILMQLGSHVHSQDIKAPAYQTLALPMFVTAAVTPQSLNNPTYSTLTLEKEDNKYYVDDASWHSLQLYKYILNQEIQFEKFRPQRQLGVDIGDAQSVREMVSNLSDDLGDFIGYAVMILGYPLLFQEVAKIVLPQLASMEKFQKNYVCAMSHYLVEDFEACLADGEAEK